MGAILTFACSKQGEIMKRFWLYFCLLVFPALLMGEASMCYRDIEKDFFQEVFVNQALSIHNVSQSTWKPINIKLRENTRRVPELVKQRVATLRRDPFKSPFQPDVAGDVLRYALFEVFSSTLAEFNVTNGSDVSEMFRYLRERQQARFVACFGPGEIDAP